MQGRKATRRDTQEDRNDPNILSQKHLFENTTLDDIDLPSTQLSSSSNAESDDPSNFEVGLNAKRPFKRLIDDKHPCKTITGFRIEDKKRQVQVQWWEKENDSNRHGTTWEPLWKWV